MNFENFGLMDNAYFISKKQIFEWIKSITGV